MHLDEDTADALRQIIKENPALMDPANTGAGGGLLPPLPPIERQEGPRQTPGMEERLSKLEGQMEGHKFVNGVTLAVAAIVVSVAIGGFAYTFSRLDQIDAKVSALPGQIKDDLRELNRAFGDAVTATRQAQPQPPLIIQVPAPPVHPSPPTAPPARQP